MDFEKDSRRLWTRRSTIVLASFVAVFLITTILFAILFAFERRQNQSFHLTKAINQSDICFTPYCIRAANDLLESINQTIDPCENFYEFACGSWIDKMKIPDDRSSQDVMTILHGELIESIIEILSETEKQPESNSFKKAQRLFESCMNESSIESYDIHSMISFINDELGGWPLLSESSWNEAKFDLAQTLNKFNQHSLSTFFSILTQLDEKNSSNFCIYIGQSSLILRDPSFYTEDSIIAEAYQTLLADIAFLFNNGNSINQTDVQEIFTLEKKLAKFYVTAKEKKLRNYQTTSATMTNLTSTIDTPFNFADHIRDLYQMANVTLQDDDIVLVTELDYIRNVSLMIYDESPRTLQNYLVWRFLTDFLLQMPKRFRIVKQRFDQIYDGSNTESARATTCANYVNDHMALAISKIYLEKYFDKTARSQSLEMTNNIRSVFIEMINESSWMDEQSKNKAIEKAKSIGEKIGYPEYFDDENSTKLENEYALYNITDSFLDNSLAILKLEIMTNRQMLRKPIEQNTWMDLAPTVVNAFYAASLNDIFFPAAFLQPPYFHKDAPKYLNYGGIGVVIGHEITHGFDDNGRQYDKDGNRIAWWSNATIENFNQRKTCMIEQYSNFTWAQANMTLRGEQTQGENIADNGGIKQAFRAYQRWSRENPNDDQKLPGLQQYTPEQMFFINFGQIWCTKMTNQRAKQSVLTGVHSPAPFRVIGSTANLPEFDIAFQCTPGDGNSRVEKCSVW